MDNAGEVTFLKSALLLTQQSLLAAFSVMVYDYVITFGAEVKYIWRTQISFITVLFVLNRYLGLFAVTFDTFILFTHNLSEKFCKVWILYHFAGSISLLAIGDAILICRLHAVYERRWKITGPLAFGAISGAVACAAMSYAAKTQAAPSPSPIAACQIINMPYWSRFVWLWLLTVETMLCLAMVYKAWGLWTEQKAIIGIIPVPKLLRRIISDSILYFLSIFIVLLLNAVAWIAAPFQYSFLGAAWAETIPCVMGSRLLLNIRAHYHDEETVLDTSGTLPMSFRVVTSLDTPRMNEPVTSTLT